MGRPNVGMRHGTLTCYQKGCRCSDCRDNHTLYMREYRARQNTGTYVWRSKAQRVDATAMDRVASKIGDDFPALGCLIRNLSTASA